MNGKIPYRLVTNPNKQELDSMLTAAIYILEDIRFNLRQDDSNIEDFKRYTIILYSLCKEDYKPYMQASYFKENKPKNEMD